VSESKHSRFIKKSRQPRNGDAYFAGQLLPTEGTAKGVSLEML
jgi:hypothetical protein